MFYDATFQIYYNTLLYVFHGDVNCPPCSTSIFVPLLQEKEAAYERYKEAYVERSDQRGRSQLETDSLNEHLRLANAALQEGARQT